MEIERKFLLQSLPKDFNQYENAEIEQAYISVDPTIRLRRRNNEYYLTVKQSGRLAREETEFVITKKQFDHLWKKIETNIVYKTRVLIPLENGLTAEADIYHGVLQGLMTVEVEFDSIEQANRFEPPGWFGLDVTYDPNYSNSSLAINGMCLINRLKS